MRISDWSSDVCASDLGVPTTICAPPRNERRSFDASIPPTHVAIRAPALPYNQASSRLTCNASSRVGAITSARGRSEEHTSELPSLMRNSYAVVCLKKKNNKDPGQSNKKIKRQQ